MAQVIMWPGPVRFTISVGIDVDIKSTHAVLNKIFQYLNWFRGIWPIRRNTYILLRYQISRNIGGGCSASACAF